MIGRPRLQNARFDQGRELAAVTTQGIRKVGQPTQTDRVESMIQFGASFGYNSLF